MYSGWRSLPQKMARSPPSLCRMALFLTQVPAWSLIYQLFAWSLFHYLRGHSFYYWRGQSFTFCVVSCSLFAWSEGEVVTWLEQWDDNGRPNACGVRSCLTKNGWSSSTLMSSNVIRILEKLAVHDDTFGGCFTIEIDFQVWDESNCYGNEVRERWGR